MSSLSKRNIVIVVGALDDRVGAIVAQVPGYLDELPSADPDGALFEAFREVFLQGYLLVFLEALNLN